MKILVTGGAGYLGTHTAVALAESGHEPIILDNFSNSNPQVLDGLAEILGAPPLLYTGDINDPEFLDDLLTKEPRIDGVIHFAAYKSVAESLKEPLTYYHNNVAGMITLLEALAKHNVKNLIFSSSATVYGEPDVNPLPETAPRKPATNPYGTTKAMCEDILSDTARVSDLRVIALRYFNPIGAHPSSKIGELPLGTPANLVPYLLQVAAGERDTLSVYGDDYDTPDGTGIRDYIHVMDLAHAHVAALDRLALVTPEPYTVYNVGTGNGTSVKELITQFEDISGKALPYKIVDRRPGDIGECWADPNRLMSELNWKPQYSVHDALTHAWAWQQTLK